MLDEPADTLKGSGPGPAFSLTVFGKHPGWNDHMSPIGLSTPSLQAFRQWLYMDGIRSQIDSGAWESLEERAKVPDWNHEMLILGTTGMILANIWASSDGKGRRAYPMVAALHVPTARLPESLAPLYRVLARVRHNCEEGFTQERVKEAVSDGEQGVEEAKGELGPLAPGQPSREERMAFLDDPAMGQDREGFYRLLHSMASELGNFAPGSKGKRSSSAAYRLFRLPFNLGNPSACRLMWRLFYQPHLRDSVLWHISNPLDESWCDIGVGDLEMEQVYRMRVRSSGIPPVSEIAYNIAKDTLARADVVLAAFEQPGTEAPPIAGGGAKKQSGGGLLGSLVNKIFRDDN